MTIDGAREYVVIVNGGSGCIIQPMSDQYSYLLTAKHNIEKGGNDLKEIIQYIYTDGDWVENSIKLEKFEKGINYFPHPEKDIAIIKLPVQPKHTDAYRFEEIGKDKTGFCLMGYPEQRRKGNPDDRKQWFRRDTEVEVIDPRDRGMYEARIPGNATLAEVMGQSGGCLCKVYKDKLYIAGIQNTMADKKEELGRVRFTAIKTFDEIVALHLNDLAPIFPCHLKSFSFLRSEAFNLQPGLYDDNIKYVKAFLRDKIEDVLQNAITPAAIKKIFENRLLLFNESSTTLQSKKIWIIWLEFLTILNLLKKQDYTERGIQKIFNKIRLLCSDTSNDWSRELTNMIYADYKGLPKGSKVIIGTSVAPLANSYKLNGEIMQIDRVIKDEKSKVDRQMLQIDKGVTFPLSDYEFIHIAYFKHGAIIDKNNDYGALLDDEQKIFAKLQEEYKELILND